MTDGSGAGVSDERCCTPGRTAKQAIAFSECD
jgi:hypothetical protein